MIETRERLIAIYLDMNMRARSLVLLTVGLVVIASLVGSLVMTWSVSGQTDIGEPTNFYVTVINFRVPPLYFSLNWEPPTSNSTTITGYEIDRSVDDWNTGKQYPWRRLANVSANTYSYADRDIVTCEGWYLYRLRAKSGSRTSAAVTDSYYIGFPPGCPGEPVIVPDPPDSNTNTHA